MKFLIVLGFCLAVALALPAPDQPDDQEQEQLARRKLNSVRLQLVDNDKKHTTQLGHSNPNAAQRSYYGQSYDLGSLSFRYYSPYYYGTYRPPYYDTGDYYNKYYDNNRYYKGYGTYGGDKAPTYGTGYGTGYDGEGYTNTYYKQGYAHQPYLRELDDEDDNQR
ncbi:probable peroxisomal membrane protein PEX13 isoform X2 [Nymphalis io]|uniref:probable peroxisomal membrane protein PEX13 isoform X2 n=1 Tax=Inachis io TaxID=171585 RepID=UPI0021674304|nr:probable peroxisomal membrane protein PEX13 isoform X2 [Nymphalis io]